MTVLRRLNKTNSIRIQKIEKTISHVDLTAAATSQAIDFASAMPADAVVVAAEIEIAQAFSGGSSNAVTADVGEKSGDTDGYIDGANVFTGATSPVSNPRGVIIPGQGASKTPVITIASNVNVDTLTAGRLTARVYYFRKTQV